jgi:prophage regulatory protein
MGQRLISMKEITERVPYTKAHIYRLIRRGEFPNRIRIGLRRVCWRESDIEAWLNAKIETAAKG